MIWKKVVGVMEYHDGTLMECIINPPPNHDERNAIWIALFWYSYDSKNREH